MSKLKLNNFPSYIDGINAFEFNEVDMGESSISTSIMLDAKIDPDFKPDWSVEYLGEKFILDSILPSGIKDNSSMRYKYSLIFKSEIQELKKYPFLDMVDLGSGNQLPSVSSFSFQGTLTEFIDRYNLNLKYYVGDKWSMVYDSQDPIPTKSITVSVSNASLWSMLTQIYDLYEVRWIRDGYSIKVGALASEIEHIFEYGKNNGLYSIERVNPNADLYTRLIGVGGSTNMPESYFKLNDPDTNNIIKTMYFSGIVPKQYRDYIRGWNAGVISQSENDAYNKGAQDKLDGKRMQPIDYAEDNIDKWGVRYGTIQANDEIFPTIQGAEREGLGRIDEIIDVEAVTNDDWQATEEGKGSIQTVKNASSSVVIPDQQYKELYVYSNPFHVTDKDSFIRLVFTTYPTILDGTQPNGLADKMKSTKEIRVLDMSGNEVYRSQNLTSNTHTIYSLPSGMYKLEGYTNTRYTGGFGDEAVLTIEMSSIKVHNPNDSTAFSDYYNVWIKDIGFDLRNQSYWTSKRMVLMYSDGMLAGEDYEFELVAEELEDGSLKPYIYEDDSREHNGIKSKYRITLKKSDAELEATGKYLPNMMQNAKAGDHFFLINIALPHEYVLDAERRVSNWLQEEVAKTSDEAPTFSIKASSIFMADFAESDLMRAGTKLRVRDSRLIGDSYLPLYIQSQTISHKENKILPDYTIIVSDDIIATKNPIELLQSSVARLSSGTLSKQQVSEISRQFERFFLRKDGISDVSYSPTHFKDDVTHTGVVKSDDFRQGDLSGAGFAMYRDEAGASVIEADKIVGRREFRTNEIKVNQVTFFGGKQIFSAAGMTCSNVEELTDGWKCYFDTKMGTVRNLFKIGDQAYHQTTSPDGSLVTNYFWRLVTELGADYIVISKTLGDGSGYPVVGNDIAQLGHPTDKSRQSALEIDMTRSGGGLVTWFDNINTFNLVKKDSVSIGKINGEVWAQVYGNAYIGERDQSTYLRHYNGVTEFKGRAEFTSGQAKEDIDKAIVDANNANDKVDNIKIGGVNLLPNTNQGTKGWRYQVQNGSNSYSEVEALGVRACKNTCNVVSTGYHVLCHSINRSLIKNNTQYTLSVDVFCEFATTARFFLVAVNGVNQLVHFGDKAIPANTWTRIELTATTNSNTETNQVMYITGFNKLGAVTFANLKLEEGNKATSWSPSPEDIETGINNAQNTANDAQSKANSTQSYIDNILQGKLEDIQDQLDGKVESYFYDYDPTINNIPASEWVTTEDKDAHLNDTFTNTHSGESWRWLKIDGVYQWVRISDSAAIEALELASRALDTADNKRRVFVATPYPPYDKGDMWAQGINGGIFVCTSPRQTGSFIASDWGKASNYTDDTLAKKAEQDALNAQNSADSAQQSANDVSNSINDLNTYIDGAFKDGIIDESEAIAIASLINTVNESFSSLDGAYGTLYSNQYLMGTAKSNLKSKYDLVAAAKNALITSINNAIADGKTTEAERDDVNSKYSVYNARIKDYYSSVETANKSIQDKLDELSTNKVDNIQIGGVNLKNNSKTLNGLFRTPDKLAVKNGDWMRFNISDFYDEVVQYQFVDVNPSTEYCQSVLFRTDATEVSFVFTWWNLINFHRETSAIIEKLDNVTYRAYAIFKTYPNDVNIRTFNIRKASSTGGTYIEFAYSKFEQGNKPTSWSPSINDVNSAISTAQSDADEAKQIADNAQNSATQANNKLSEIANDNLLTPTEKIDTKAEWDIIVSEKPVVTSQANKIGANTSTYNSAYNTLNTYITPLLANMNANSTISGNTFRSNFKNYYDAKVSLLKTISDLLKDVADSKAQTFKTQPIPPYRVGDLWLSSSGVFQCVNARASGSFAKSDWSLTDLHDNTKTVIDGGVVTSGTIRLAGDDNAIKAGITGNGTADSSVRVWAGATEANKNNAPFIVRQDGSMKATKASIEGSITATKGYIGGFEIGYNRIGATSSSNSTTGEGLSIYDNFIKFSDSDTWASIGTNVLPGTTGATGVGRFSNTESNSNGTNYGLLVSVRNATNNLAIVTSGDIVANGAINSYVYSTITPAYNTVHIPGELTSPTMFNIIAKFTNKDSGIGLLTRSSIVSKLNISYSTPFAVKMTIICSADSTKTGFVIGRNTIIGDMDTNQYPYRLNNDASVDTGKTNLAKGDVIEFMLVWDNVNYRAYELNRRT